MNDERHPGWKQIVDAAEAVGDASVVDHVRTCPRCSTLEERAKEILHRFAEARFGRPTEDVMGRVRAAIRRALEEEVHPTEPAPAARARTGEGARLAGALREIWAALAADSLQPSHAFRGAVSATARTLLYEAPDHAVTVSLVPTNGGAAVNLYGQVVPKHGSALPEGGAATLVSGERRIEAPLSSFGEFSFLDERAAPRDLSIRLADVLIRISLPGDG